MPASTVPYLRRVEAKLRIELHPSQAQDVKVAVREHLNTLLMRYNEELGGVVLAYTDVVLQGSKGRILTTLSPYIHLDLTANLLVFAPSPQNVLVGSVNKVGPAHIGLLTLGAFNASIAADKIGEAFEYDQDSSAWVDNESRIAVGSEVKFAVHRVHDEGNFLSLSGSLLASETGPRASIEAAEARDGTQGAADAVPSVPKRKRKKGEHTFIEDSIPEAGVTRPGESQQGRVDETTELGKKKKKRRVIEGDVEEEAPPKAVPQEFRQWIEERKRKGQTKSKH